jgi:hypothetical protein
MDACHAAHAILNAIAATVTTTTAIDSGDEHAKRLKD